MSGDDPHDPLLAAAMRRRVTWSVALAVGVVVAATVTVPTFGRGDPTGGSVDQVRGGGDAFKQQQLALTGEEVAGQGAEPDDGHGNGHGDGHGDGHDHGSHDHSDATTKNAISRSSEVATAADPTSPEQAARNAAQVAEQRDEADPTLVPGPADTPRRDSPEDRYAMAGGCYALQSTVTGRWVLRSEDGFRASADRAADGERFHFQATDLGRYLLLGSDDTFMAKAENGLLERDKVVADPAAGPRADWTARGAGGTSYSFGLGRQGLAVAPDGRLVLGSTAAPFTLHRVDGCAEWPEVETNVFGRPHAGVTGIQEVRGYLDAHTHGMAFEFLGGEVHCGRPWHPYGVEAALRDCPDHEVADGNGAVLENFLRDGSPAGQHDPVGWPTFKDWPAPDSLTHEGTYYKWMERAWRGGQRLFVNLLVENNKLCEVYPLKRNSCDDMDSIRLQAQRMRELERYVDAQSGGPGEGWYRIVTDPFQAREVINAGKLAVVMGIETSVLFGCTMKLDVPQCTETSIDRQLDEVHDLGVRQMELVNKFDNALSGVAGDEGTTGIVINSANFAETGTFWAMSQCPADRAKGVHDKEQATAPGATPERDMLFGAVAENYVTRGRAPLYPSAPHCNQRGLSPLGEHTIREMVQRKMIFDPDHMSVKARQASLDLLESLRYSGVVSSHSWSTPDAYPRIYRLGGVVAPYAGDSEGFVEKWRKHIGWADGRFYFGFGFGADINGLGAQGDPRGAGVANPVTYPFAGIGGVTVDRNVSGERVYDINTDGVAHYGLYPDWVEDLRQIGGEEVVDDMSRGPEAYLQMWERALGIGNDACRDTSALKPERAFRDLDPGSTAREVLFRMGQPHARLGDSFTYCARSRSGRTVEVTLDFAEGARLAR